MKAVTKILAAGVGFAALAGAAPAAAQYYPGYPGYGSGGGLGAIIDAILGAQRHGQYGQYGQPYGYGQYGYNPQQERYLVERCARTTEARIQRSYGGYNYGGYGGYGYNNNYGGQARIVSITNVQRRSNGRLQIYGTATSGRTAYQQPYGGYGYNQPYGGYGYNQPYAAADLRFDCTIDYRGRVTDVDIERNRYR